jgi:hypothetical protein
MLNIRHLVSALGLAATLLTGTTMRSSAADRSQEINNLIYFHLIDFVGWNNNNMDVMRKYHSPQVVVDMVGVHTDGIDAHVGMITQTLSSGAAKILQHSPILAQGEWTAVVGMTGGGNMATIGKWKDGALSEEYIFVRPLTSDEAKAVDVSQPIVTITTPDDQELRAANGAEPAGALLWSMAMLSSPKPSAARLFKLSASRANELPPCLTRVRQCGSRVREPIKE